MNKKIKFLIPKLLYTKAPNVSKPHHYESRSRLPGFYKNKVTQSLTEPCLNWDSLTNRIHHYTILKLKPTYQCRETTDQLQECKHLPCRPYSKVKFTSSRFDVSQQWKGMQIHCQRRQPSSPTASTYSPLRMGDSDEQRKKKMASAI